jgi:hypothetical protein
MAKNMLERTIDQYCRHLKSKGIHCHKNNPLRLHDGRYVQGEPFDYEIMTNPAKLFDAKEVSDDYLRIRKKEIKQLKALHDCENAGHNAFFLIWFSKHMKLMKISATRCTELLIKQKTIHYKNCTEVKNIDDI